MDEVLFEALRDRIQRSIIEVIGIGTIATPDVIELIKRACAEAINRPLITITVMLPPAEEERRDD